MTERRLPANSVVPRIEGIRKVRRWARYRRMMWRQIVPRERGEERDARCKVANIRAALFLKRYGVTHYAE